ncbi:hypothetical protein HY214_01735 [Candidatus Roizmanbacteria bacterium]|nr:hypothetical protein [Candidatus Roizmanbacteria bacterium]
MYGDFQIGGQLFAFDRSVTDAYQQPERGQLMLRATLPASENLLVADVAGYLFGFPFEDMLVAAGSLTFVEAQVSAHYATRYPGILAKALKPR